MARLTLSFNQEVMAEHEFDREEMTIGRKPDDDIQTDGVAVSSHHARIVTVLGDPFLEERNSTNGTYVNGTRVQKHALQDGDAIGIGKHVPTCSSEALSGPGDDLEGTWVIPPDTRNMSGNTASESPDRPVEAGDRNPENDTTEAIREPAAGPRVRIVSGARAARERELRNPLTTLGKPGVQVASLARRAQG